MTEGSEAAKLRQDVLLAEFKGLRDEIQYRTNAQNSLTSIQLVASSALAALIFREDAGRALALVLAPLSAATGLLRLDHARAINKIGSYIRQELWPALRNHSDTRLPTYEEHKERDPDATIPDAAAPDSAPSGTGGRWRRQGALILTFPFTMVFVLPAGIGVVAPLVPTGKLTIFVIVGSTAALLPVLVLLGFWWRTLRRLLPAKA